MFLGILDLYGFESFDHGNSLEQLCINYANERLQFYFSVNYLKEQQQHLANEGSIKDMFSAYMQLTLLNVKQFRFGLYQSG